VRRCAAKITAHYVKPIGKEELEAILAKVSVGVFCSTKNDRSDGKNRSAQSASSGE
jgi:hypothetical protein